MVIGQNDMTRKYKDHRYLTLIIKTLEITTLLRKKLHCQAKHESFHDSRHRVAASSQFKQQSTL